MEVTGTAVMCVVPRLFFYVGLLGQSFALQPPKLNHSFSFAAMAIRWRRQVSAAFPKVKEETWPVFQAAMDMYNGRMAAIMVRLSCYALNKIGIL